MPRKRRKNLLRQEAEMKICIPGISPNGLESELSEHFGSAPVYILYHTEKKTLETVKNENTEHRHGSCMPVDLLKRLNVEAVLCRGMGARAAGLLLSAGIRPYLVEAATVSEAIHKYEVQETKELNGENACRHHQCH
jgi:predicted Fe-Mo cluster-binding NifX family protein